MSKNKTNEKIEEINIETMEKIQPEGTVERSVGEDKFESDNKEYDTEEDKIITKGNKKRVALYSLVFAAVCILSAAAAFCCVSSLPSRAVLKGFKNTISDFAAYENIYAEKSEEIKTLLAEPIKLEADIGISSQDKEAKYNFVHLYDSENKKASVNINVSADGKDENILKAYTDNENLLIGSEKFLGNEIFGIPLVNMLSSYNNSGLSEIFGKREYSEDISIDFFKADILGKQYSEGRLVKEYFSEEREAEKNLKENVEIYENGEVYDVSEDEKKKAKGYTVRTEGLYVSKVIEDLIEYMEENNSSAELVKEVLPLVRYLTGSEITAEEAIELLDKSKYGELSALAQELSSQNVEVNVFLYKKRIVKAEYTIGLHDEYGGLTDYSVEFETGDPMEKNHKNVSMNISTRDGAVYGGKAEASEDGSINMSFEHFENILGAEYKTTADMYYEPNYEYGFEFKVENQEDSLDSTQFKSNGKFLADKNGISLTSEETVLSSGTGKIADVDIKKLEITPLEEGVTPTEATAEIFEMTEDELSELMVELYSLL